MINVGAPALLSLWRKDSLWRGFLVSAGGVICPEDVLGDVGAEVVLMLVLSTAAVGRRRCTVPWTTMFLFPPCRSPTLSAWPRVLHDVCDIPQCKVFFPCLFFILRSPQCGRNKLRLSFNFPQCSCGPILANIEGTPTSLLASGPLQSLCFAYRLSNYSS